MSRLYKNMLSNKNLTANAQKLRRDMTKEEKRLWYDFLKDYPIKFHRQKVIGNYIADFYSAAAKIVIELDGSQHYEDLGVKKDKIRDRFMQENGFKVLRYSNFEINDNFEGVCINIEQKVMAQMSAPESSALDKSSQ